ncbi:MAG: threonine synthase [Rickettsia endosymbiont of Ixodes persulcatus]|nr:threonine synthase [Rickettsia endosymbiont of Ixodes persulcatus]
MYITTRNKLPKVDFYNALLTGLAPDGGLYIPDHFPNLKTEIAEHMQTFSLPTLGTNILKHFDTGIPENDLEILIKNALSFPIPLVPLRENMFLLEVFHGPTLSFKDVGARFMANVLSYFLQQKNQRVIILVATSGDTGSAIAHAFHNKPNVDVFILFPSKKISFLQEQQMTTLGGNVHAIEVEGTFDDCQAFVKKALLDDEIRQNHILTTANSINISRLLPQILFHGWGVVQLFQQGISIPPILSVPSGNFGNLVSALYAERIGIPIENFIAATNINAIVPRYLETGSFVSQPSQKSYSNAMDVGNPSNFERLLAFFNNDLEAIRNSIKGISITDEQTIEQIRKTYEQTGYILDPHTAVGVAAAKAAGIRNDLPIIVTATAHPAKFPEVIKFALGFDIELPPSLKATLDLPKKVVKIKPQYSELKTLLLYSKS